VVVEIGSDSDVCSSSMTDDESIPESLNMIGVKYSVEANIFETSNHATNAHYQRLLASSKIAEAKSLFDLSWEECR